MLCGSCKKIFVKVQNLEVMQNANNNKLETGLFDLHKLIQTDQNMDRCPFCSALVFIILSSNLIVGDQSEINYSRKND